jgi:hypothetical protein
MRTPGFGEANLGALAGAVVGGIGGLFAIGIPRAVLERDPAAIFMTPLLNVICLVISWPVGWVLGGQVGPRLGMRFRSEKAEVAGGIFCGLLPVILIMLFGWYVTTH